MQLHVSVVDCRNERSAVGAQRYVKDCIVDALPGHTVADLAAAIAAMPWPASRAYNEGGPTPRLWRDGTSLDPAATLAACGIRDGVVLGLGGDAGAGHGRSTTGGRNRPNNAVAEVRVVGGPDAGTTLQLGPGRYLIGRSGEATLVLADPKVSAQHLVLDIAAAMNGFTCTAWDPGSTNGTNLDGRDFGKDEIVPIPAGSLLTIGHSMLTVERLDVDQTAAIRPTRGDDPTGLRPNRAPRSVAYRAAVEVFEPVAGPQAEPARQSLMMTLMPAGLGLGMSVALIATTGNWLFAGISVLGVATPIFSRIGPARGQRSRAKQEQDDFQKRSAAREQRLADLRDAERRRRRAAFADPARLREIAIRPSTRLWEREPGDEDFLVVRVGWADLPAEDFGVAGDDLADQGIATLRSVPATVSLREAGALGVVGDTALGRTTVAWMLCQLAVLHRPSVLNMVLLTEAPAAWEWFAWLPHARGRRFDAQMAAGTEQRDIRERITELRLLIEERAASRSTAPALPAIVVVVDGSDTMADLPGFTSVVTDGPAVGVYVIYCDRLQKRLPTGFTSHIEVAAANDRSVGDIFRPGSAVTHVKLLDHVRAPWVEEVTRALAPVRDDADRGDQTSDAPARLLDLLALGTPIGAGIESAWQRESAPLVTLGTVHGDGAGGRSGRLSVDLASDGPHLLVTAQADQESAADAFLRVVVSGLAVRTRPDRLIMLLLDGDGGSVLAGCEQLPHAHVPSFERKDEGPSRALGLLEREISRRTAHGAPEGEPRLVVVATRSVTRAWQHADLVGRLADLAARAVRVGVHLVLATDRSGELMLNSAASGFGLRVSVDLQDMHIRARGQAVRFLPATVDLAYPTDVGTSALPQVTQCTLSSLSRKPSTAATQSAETPADLAVIVEAVRLTAERLHISPAEIPVPSEPLLSPLDFTDLLGIGDPASFDARRSWRQLSPEDRLRMPIGVGENGEPVILDIKEAAMGGMGPHGLCIGATGSGKSEVLRTLVLALAATHSSENLNFVLSDFKGGATFAGMAEMPHTAAVITNLADDLTMVDRMRDAIVGEMNRRQEMLRDGGNFKNIHDYEKARSAGAALTPMPNLLIVLDEFSEMLTAKPEFLDLFIQIGRIGRSLGVHLLLASQRLEEGKLRGLDTYLSYRLGLKTFSPAESRAVLGVPDAFTLPPVPGSGYLKTVGSDQGAPTGVRFKAAYVSGPAPSGPTSSTVLDVLVDKMRGQGPSAHQVWLPPLDAPPTLDQLMPNPLTTAYTLTCTVGIADEPLKQRRLPYTLDFSGAAGHAVIVGGPRTGKSTLLRTMLLGLALRHTPAQVQFFGLDFGGGTLASLGDLPHISGVGGRLDEDLVRRIASEVVSILDKREESFRQHGIDSIGTFRARRTRGELPDEPFGDVFLVIDGWSTLRADFPQLEQDILEIAQRGLGFGVHVVITAARWPEIRPQLKDAINTRIELRLGDPTESVVDRRVAANVPAGAPGRGLTTGKLHFLAALPRIDGIQDAADLADGVAKAVHAITDASQGLAAPKVRMLPLLVRYADLPAPAARPTRSVPLGVDEAKLEPVYLNFDADPHFLLFGEGESGKSSVLRTLIQGVVDGYSPRQARVLAVDYRRSLLEFFPESHKLAYCAAGPAAQSAIISACDVLRGRLPGLDVTAQQLRERSWWTGAELFVVVDDYDLVAGSSGNPLSPLAEFLPMARDVGLHLIIARATGGAGRALFDPFIQRLRETRQPGLVLSGERDEGALLGQVRPSRQPPGRGTLVSRRHGSMLIQTAYLQSTE